MLPILRVIPVGGVLLAIAILILALNPPGDPHLGDAIAPLGGALIARDQHPEWRQLLILAAVRRADELRRLRELPDTPIRSVPPEAPPKVKKPAIAAVPHNRNDAESEDVTGTIVQSPNASIPVDIGEMSSTELPVIPHEERPPVIMMPERNTPTDESNHTAPEKAKPHPVKRVREARRARPVAKQQSSAQFNLFESLFGR